MPQIKPGTRLKSAVCATEVMVVAAPKEPVELSCGGAPMCELSDEPAGASLDPDAAAGTQLGHGLVEEAEALVERLTEALFFASHDLSNEISALLQLRVVVAHRRDDHVHHLV